ncbi:pilus assembly protein [Paenibacillus sp. J5C_2022]|uniref:TadE/TadG family type IV pilus assembly protein n=1 Tax=Paenibacillus sp. J5C2022 TaxID=2977129 RepID=UPI0021CE5EA0|nr:TadE/TadG family type IV pilus assembly protein [Paenibacillus sp. J5C2022]MCU6710910.1 pilus assembly protein [Paenibacillus sp. J5C2022]
MIRQTRFSRLAESWRIWLAGDRGSYTLESAIVFPLLFAVVLLFLVLGLYLHQKVVVLYAAAITSERAAFAWDNSHRDPASGILLQPNYDGLYRRLGGDGALASMFGLAGEDGRTAVQWPVKPGSSDENDGLTAQKLLRAARWMDGAELAYKGEISYGVSGLTGAVVSRLVQPVASKLPWEHGAMSEGPAAVYSGSVVDPVEFTRSVELVRYYTAKFGNRTGAGRAKADAREVLASYGGSGKGGMR